MRHPSLPVAAALLCMAGAASASVITFETFILPASGYDNGSDGLGGFPADGATFNNNYDADTGTWSGFAISNLTDTLTAGPSNPYSAITGGGFGGSSNYAVGLYTTTEAVTTHVIFDALTDLTGLGAYFTNTTWAAFEMREGTEKFGGPLGNDPDWLILTIEGFVGLSSTGPAIEFYLADFRSADNTLDYIVSDWRFQSFSQLGSVERLEMSLSSTRTVPLYFAMDSFLIPEPATLAMGAAGLLLLLRRKR